MKCAFCGKESEGFDHCPFCGYAMNSIEKDHIAEQIEGKIDDIDQTIMDNQKENLSSDGLHRKPFGVGKTLAVIFSSIFGGLLLVVVVLACMFQLNPFHLNDWYDVSDQYDSFDHHSSDWDNIFGEWY